MHVPLTGEIASYACWMKFVRVCVSYVSKEASFAQQDSIFLTVLPDLAHVSRWQRLSRLLYNECTKNRPDISILAHGLHKLNIAQSMQPKYNDPNCSPLTKPINPFGPSLTLTPYLVLTSAYISKINPFLLTLS